MNFFLEIFSKYVWLKETNAIGHLTPFDDLKNTFFKFFSEKKKFVLKRKFFLCYLRTFFGVTNFNIQYLH